MLDQDENSAMKSFSVFSGHEDTSLFTKFIRDHVEVS